VSYNISYTKQDINPSKGKLGAPGTASGSGSASPNTTLILVVVGVIVVLGLVFYFIPQFRAKPQRVVSRSERRQAARSAKHGPASKNKFCRYCGKPTQGNDRFCPSCGQPVD